ncbi:MAG: NADH:ubiquinone oxidoreductase subunit H [[Candidatus Thermochlorobacteriaceae] bacterium GBChlB]|nr:MAG: NADH:ubiquinone oxidoreductase subunit H [[Candidatus Thermochlorobacteriaceae] bacterium GBChlB]
MELAHRVALGVVMITVIILSVVLTVWSERRVAAFIQHRVGPNRVGPFGLLQPFADVMKLLFKEDVVPSSANRFYHVLAPMISLFAAMTTVAVVPFANGIAIADVNVGMLYILAITSLGVYGLTIAGWASNNKYSLLGGLRSSAQMISYELAMGLSVVSVIVLADSLNMTNIVESQTANPLYWNCFRNFLGFVCFTVAAFAECNRAPFDLPEAEQELVGGYNTEFGAMKFAMFFLAEYANMIVASMVIVTLFLGGYQVPFWSEAPWFVQVGAFAAKTVLMIFVFIWVRWSVPRFKYSQLMNLGWKSLLPLALLNLLLVAAGVLLLGGK